jgi:hypothetical protein
MLELCYGCIAQASDGCAAAWPRAGALQAAPSHRPLKRRPPKQDRAGQGRRALKPPPGKAPPGRRPQATTAHACMPQKKAKSGTERDKNMADQGGPTVRQQGRCCIAAAAHGQLAARSPCSSLAQGPARRSLAPRRQASMQCMHACIEACPWLPPLGMGLAPDAIIEGP